MTAVLCLSTMMAGFIALSLASVANLPHMMVIYTTIVTIVAIAKAETREKQSTQQEQLLTEIRDLLRENSRYVK